MILFFLNEYSNMDTPDYNEVVMSEHPTNSPCYTSPRVPATAEIARNILVISFREFPGMFLSCLAPRPMSAASDRTLYNSGSLFCWDDCIEFCRHVVAQNLAAGRPRPN
jgi:hypothetical protein